MPQTFPACRAVVVPQARPLLDPLLATAADDQAVATALASLANQGRLPGFIADLFRLEGMVGRVAADHAPLPVTVAELTINPSLNLLAVEWSGLDRLLTDPAANCQPAAGTHLLVWRHPRSGEVRTRQATAADLLALKVVAETLRPEAIAEQQGVAVGLLDRAIRQAVDEGLLLAPPSALHRPPSPASDPALVARFATAEVFSLQWHITQTCDLHCKHCYDRTSRPELPLAKALAVLDDLRAFCRHRSVHGQVTFTGGNPLLYPHFLELYQAAVDRGLGVAILGNPAPRQQLEALLAVAKPLYFQVSLEGLEPHNDHIRGAGHFQKVLSFLALLKELGISSMVMLTLTRANQEQVLPLAEILRDKVDLFTFNRLASVGEATGLQGPAVDSYPRFLTAFLEAARTNPCLGLKENLFNLSLAAQGGEPFGGCAGHGCGAAFNFLALLADGEVHACRKFPSLIGNLFTHSLAELYDSGPALSYRQGSAACRGCRLRPVCGGCLAVVHGLGLDPLQDRDPYCWGPESN